MYVGIAVQCTWRNCTSTMLIHYVLLFNKFVAADCYQSQYCYRTLLLLYLHLKPKPICCYRIMGENGIIWPLKLCTPATVDLQHCSINSRLHDRKKSWILDWDYVVFCHNQTWPPVKAIFGPIEEEKSWFQKCFCDRIHSIWFLCSMIFVILSILTAYFSFLKVPFYKRWNDVSSFGE